jgi:hypothetical protein
MKHTEVIRTVPFTRAELSRIQQAAKICGWRPGDANFARNILLGSVAEILRSNEPTARRPQRKTKSRNRVPPVPRRPAAKNKLSEGV